ncbi:DUF5667 domain-containing protein [Streptomyces sp. NPDC048825]|uniref:DUF5667 domain-containing protein n=1 Tax=Streptomyces sp. NPDC048825 TaxID=3365592 RepID=UPI00371E8CED
MIANVSAHRRANAFAQDLEEQSDRGSAAEQSEGPAPEPTDQSGQSGQSERSRMLSLATGLGELPKPALDPEVKVVQRAQLVAAMEAMLQEGTAAAGDAVEPSVPGQRSRRGRGAHRATGLGKLRQRFPRSRLSKGLAAGGLTVGVAAGAFSGVAAASSDALPGDSLYGLKRSMEDLKRGMADGDSDRGRLYLDQASTRLSEARRLIERDRSGPLDHESMGEIRRALSGMRHDASEGHRLLHEAYERDPDSLGPIQTLSAFSQSHRGAWGALSDRLPAQLGDVSRQVSSVFDAIDQEVDPLRSLLPEPPSRDDTSRRPDSGQSSTGSSGTDRPTTPSATGDSPDGNHSSSGNPKPSTSGTQDEGLLGGNTGGLLEPPKDDTSTTPSSEPTTPTDPDVTVPPLLPGLLPEVRVDNEDTN